MDGDVGTEVPKGKHLLAAMDKTGDSKFMWDPKNKDEVAAAKAQFDALKKKGYIAFTVDKKGDKGEIIREFDPELEKIIMTPPIAGG
jgi:hypothetical protein